MTGSIWVGTGFIENNNYIDSLKFINDTTVDWVSGYQKGECWHDAYFINGDTIVIESRPIYSSERDIVKLVKSNNKLRIIYYADQETKDLFKEYSLDSLKVALTFNKE